MTMATSKFSGGAVRTAPRHACGCGCECESGARYNYFLGTQMGPASFRLEQRYLNERRRLLNRAIHGWGVVHGFALDRGADGRLGIGKGLALDVAGRELVQPGRTDFALDELLILDADGNPSRADGGYDARIAAVLAQAGKTEAATAACWLLRVHYAERKIGPVTLRDTCGCEHEDWDRTCETVVYSLQLTDCASCCAPQACELDCGCPPDTGCCATPETEQGKAWRELRETYAGALAAAGDSDQARREVYGTYEARFAELTEAMIDHQAPLQGRGGCACLCEHVTGLEIGDDCARLCEIEPCMSVDIGRGRGVPLACVRLAYDCDRWSISAIVDACGPRRLVKRNDLLFDLINGCDVTRISRIGWANWHRRNNPPVPFEAFAEAIGGTTPDTSQDIEGRDFWVEFSRPVRADTLRADCAAMTVIFEDWEGGWRESLRVPIVRFAPDAASARSDDPDGHVRRARFVFYGQWFADSILGLKRFSKATAYVEIEVRGDFIVDCLGQTVDANARGRAPFPSGSDGPGDSFLSTFTVARALQEARNLPKTPAASD